MKKVRIHIVLNPLLSSWAEELQSGLGFSSLSELIEHLIREEWERRSGPIQIAPSEQAHILNDGAQKESQPGTIEKGSNPAAADDLRDRVAETLLQTGNPSETPSPPVTGGR